MTLPGFAEWGMLLKNHKKAVILIYKGRKWFLVNIFDNIVEFYYIIALRNQNVIC